MSNDADVSQSAAPARKRRTQVYVLLSSLTTTLHTEEALTPWGAFGQWTESHAIEGKVLCGRTEISPFRHLSLGLETAGELHEVYVVRLQELVTPRSTLGGDAL